MKLDGKVAVITGAASGIGRATATLFAGEGARIACVDLDTGGMGSVQDRGVCRTFVGNVSDGPFVHATVASVIEAWSGIDVLVTCAAISTGKTVVETDEVEWDRVFAVNVKGTYLWLKECVPHMVAAQRGSIITIASQLAVAGGRANAAYVASKGAIIALTKAVALDHAQDGVRANVILPGATDTPMLARSFAGHPDPPAARERSRQRHAMGRFGTADEIARAILYLASDDASFTTGAALPVDGGWLVA